MVSKNLKVRLNSYTHNPLKVMWLAARNCYFKDGFSELKKQYDKDKSTEFLKRIYDKGHLSILEFPNFVFEIENISRSCLAQLTRHRIGFSYAVQSQHYQKYKDFKFKELEQYLSKEHKKEYHELMNQINQFYNKAVDNKLPRYIAREVLPNSCLNHMMMSANLRSLDNFWKLRKTSNNTPEIIKLSEGLYKATKKAIPNLEDIIIY